MTTQEHYEQNDADASVDAGVVEHPSAPGNEMTADSTTSESSLPVEAAREEDKPSSASVSDVEDKAEAHSQAPASPDASVLTAAPETSTETHEAPVVDSTTIESATETQEAPSALEVAPEGTEKEQITPTAGETPSTATTIDAPKQEQAVSGGEHQTDEVQHIDRKEYQDVLTELSTALTEVLSTMEPAANIIGVDNSAIAADENIPQPSEEATSSVGEASEPSVSGASADAKAEEVRPFTDFIAEFRQAEAALRDSQVEALSILSSAAVDLVYEEPQSQEMTTSEEVKRSDVGEPIGSIGHTAPTDKEDGSQVKIDETQRDS
ncbi:MAG: hypothetical protein H0U76_20110, partial [Ktedonobacteraceae bacterium]|nr:hypothetical protein [Ktedonobacteraceae bacterium]